MQTRRLKRFLLPVTGILLTTWIAFGLQSQTRKIDDNALKNAGNSNNAASEWLTHGLNYQETRYSLLKQIDDTNVSRLGLAWTYEIGPGGGNQEATPLVVNGVLYSITQWSVAYAVDVRTGRELWRFDPQVDRPTIQPRICCGNVVRGVAFYDGKVYIPVMDGRLMALDAAKGTEVWSVQTTPTTEPYTVTMAPRVAKGKVFIGNAGSEYPVRGFVTAYDAQTGKQVWRFYTVPGDPAKGFENKAMETAAKTWGGEWWKIGGGGGTVWDGMTYDPDTNLIMFGTGNAGPWPSDVRQSRGKDNLYTASVVALNADTGEYKWHYQFVPEDSWDFDSVQQLTLADLRINGRNRKVVMQANKNGFFYVLDRTNGQVISASPFAQVNWASEIDLKTGRPMTRPEAFYGKSQSVTIFPGPGGAHNWSPMSFNPTHNLMYIPTSANSSFGYRLPETFTYNPTGQNMAIAGFGGGGGGRGGGGAGGRGGAPATPPAPGQILDPGAAIGAGQTVPAAPPPATNAPPLVPPSVGPVDKDGKFYTGSWLIAIDPRTQTEKWRVASSSGSIGGGTLTTAGNLVFQVMNNGRLFAYKADTGVKVFETATNQTGNMGPPITFMVDNKQYIAVAGGACRGQGCPGGGGGGGGRGGAGAPPAPGGAPAGAPAGAQRGAPAPGAAAAAPAAPPVLPRLYVYALDAKAENPTPAPPAPAAPGAGAPGGFGPPPGGGPGGAPATPTPAPGTLVTPAPAAGGRGR